MNRFISNIVVGLFAVALIAVYGITKQPAVFSWERPEDDNTARLSSAAPVKVRLPSVL